MVNILFMLFIMIELCFDLISFLFKVNCQLDGSTGIFPLDGHDCFIAVAVYVGVFSEDWAGVAEP